MDVNVLRNWGIAVSAAALAGAIALSSLNRAPAGAHQNPTAEAPLSEGPLTQGPLTQGPLSQNDEALTPTPDPGAQPQAFTGDTAFETAQAPSPPAQPPRAQATAASAAAVAFLVRFRGDGPLAQAQSQAAHGNHARARRSAQAALARQGSFAGLCLDRFTVGGAETVLRSCAPMPASERAAFQQTWLARLRAMRAVEYVDVNASASQDRQ